MTNRKQYKPVFLLIQLLLLFTLSCNSNLDSNTSDKDEIIISYIGDERIFHQDYWGMESTYWIFLPLVEHAGEYNGEIQPVLAESWTHSEDYKTWTVNLRKDVYWHDGVQMTAHDIKFTIDLRKKALISTGGFNCELIDDFTFTLTSNYPITALPYHSVYYPKHLLEDLDPSTYYDWDFWKTPVGNGPYKFVRNVHRTMVEVEVNPNYFRSQPKIKKAILKFSSSPSLQELLSGNVDGLTMVPQDFLFKVKDDDRFKTYYWWGTSVKSIYWNHDNPLFKEANVRKALTMAVDRVELLKILNYPNDIPIVDILFNHNMMNTYIYRDAKKETHDNFHTPLPYNPDKAIELLQKSGWTDSNADGILDKEGVDFHFNLTVTRSDVITATYIQDKFRQIGIRLEIETIEISIIKERLKKSEFEALIWSFVNGRNISTLRSWFREDAYFGYENESLDSILNLIENTGEIKEIDRLYKELIPIFERDIPITFISPIIATSIVNNRVKGMENLLRSDPVKSLEFLWIE